MDPRIVSLLQSAFSSVHVLPQLSRASISVPSWDAFSVCMALSPALRQLTVDLGFNRARIDAKGWSNDEVAAGYLESIVTSSTTSIEQMELRGLALGHTRIANSLLKLGASLRVLTLTAGASLSPFILAGVVTFPKLEDLEVHAGHISSYELVDALKMGGDEEGVFPALRKLRVRAQPSLVELLLEKMASNKLTHLHIEAVSQPEGHRAHNWVHTFALIPAKAVSTLQELTIEHHFDLSIDNEPNSNAPAPAPTITPTPILSTPSPAIPSTASDPTEAVAWTLANLRPLERLAHLRRLVLDTTLPPSLSDADLEALAQWWPKIEHLELGGLAAEFNCGHLETTCRTTLACLRSFAKWCPKLETLVLNLDITTYPSDTQCGTTQLNLRNLALGSALVPEPSQLACYLGYIFPALEVVDGNPKFEDEFRAVNCLLHPTN